MARLPAKLLYKLIVREHYDVVISYLEGPATHIISGCPYQDSKRVAWVHVEMKTERQASAGFRSINDACQAYQNFDKVIFVAKTVKDAFEQMTGETFERSCVLYV